MRAAAGNSLRFPQAKCQEPFLFEPACGELLSRAKKGKRPPIPCRRFFILAPRARVPAKNLVPTEMIDLIRVANVPTIFFANGYWVAFTSRSLTIYPDSPCCLDQDRLAEGAATTPPLSK